MNAWKDDFTTSTKHDHMELMEYLSEMKNSQDITSGILDKKMDDSMEMTRQMMQMMQKVG